MSMNRFDRGGTVKVCEEGDFLLREGEVSTSAFYVASVALRLFFPSGDSEVTLEFFFEGAVVTSLASFKTGLPSEYALQAIEPGRIVEVPKASVESFLAAHPAFGLELIGNLEDRLIGYIDRLRSFLALTAEERYGDLVLQQPALLQRVKQKYLASYLGIQPESLSRIRHSRSHRS